MKPNWVLSDEQCKIRFRRIRQEKGALKEMKQELEEAPEILTEIKREQQTSPVATSKYNAGMLIKYSIAGSKIIKLYI